MAQTVSSAIDQFAGEDGWWRSENSKKFKVAASELIALGMTPDEAVAFLRGLYEAVKDEYGE